MSSNLKAVTLTITNPKMGGDTDYEAMAIHQLTLASHFAKFNPSASGATTEASYNGSQLYGIPEVERLVALVWNSALRTPRFLVGAPFLHKKEGRVIAIGGDGNLDLEIYRAYFRAAFPDAWKWMFGVLQRQSATMSVILAFNREVLGQTGSAAPAR